MPPGSRIPFMSHQSPHTNHPARRNSSRSHRSSEREEPVSHESETVQESNLFGAMDTNLSPEAFRVVGADSGEAGMATSDSPGRPQIDTRTSTQKFQSAGQRAMHAQRLLSYSKVQGGRAEPGIDPRRVDLPDLHQHVVIQAVDYTSNSAEFHVLSNTDLAEYLDAPREDPAAKRWIHVNGLSWDVIKALALKYDLHPLALEDILHHGTAATRSKADYYAQHLFVSIVVHKTFASDAEDDVSTETSDEPSSPPPAARRPDFTQQSEPYQGDEEAQIESSSSDADKTRVGTMGAESKPDEPLSSYDKYSIKLVDAFRRIAKAKTVDEEESRTLTTNSPGLSNAFRRLTGKVPKSAAGSHADRMAARHTVTQLTKDLRVHIHVEQLSVFLLRGGTVISFSQDPGYHSRFSNIFTRISSPGDLIRDSEDSSFVLQALVDVVGDHVLEIVDEFRDQITRLESRVLSHPDMGDVRHLHILSAQLILLKSTLTPLQHLISSIRLQDEAKAQSACKVPPASMDKKSYGFVSFEAKIFLGDVMDHVESALSSLDLFASLAENLIAYTFNNLSYSSNSYMKGLSVLSVIFLPLTFLSGYFGMNFETFPHVLDGSVSYFWKIAAPTAVFTMLIFSYEYLMDLVLTARRQTLRLYHLSLYKKKDKDKVH